MRLTTALLSTALLIATACANDPPRSVAPAEPDPSPAAVGTASSPADEVPPDGPELFAFMKTSCGPCNRIGRDAYHMREQGMTDDEVVAHVREKYGITR
jgi:hypothetical protein